MAEETNKQQVADSVKEKLEDVATDLIEKAKQSSQPWYKKALLYVLAVVLGGGAFICANYGEELVKFFEEILKGLM